MIQVSAIHIYPLKGGRGLEMSAVELDRFGPVNDRRWMVVDPDGSLVTQREVGRLCQIQATPTPDGIMLEAPGRPSLTVHRKGSGSVARQVRVWEDQVAAVDMGPIAAEWCSQFLDREVGLVALAEDADRRTDPDYDPIGAKVGFADGYPLLVISEGSLEELNRRLPSPLPMNRFRPNVVVSGVAPFEEDDWRRFSIGAVPFDGVKPCARCVVTTTDQLTGERSPEPLRTLVTFRRRGGGVMFGMNVVPRALGSIRVGDPIAVERRP